MSYDHWKTTEPDDSANPYFGRCDRCGEQRPLAPTWERGFAGEWICEDCACIGVDDTADYEETAS